VATGHCPRIIAETARWRVVDKPAGMITVPGRARGGSGQEEASLADWIRERSGEIWVVHRLDRETSGVVLFARDADSHREACRWFERREVSKFYDCLAAGEPSAPVLKLDEPVDGQRAVTQVQARERFAGAFLGRARPLTGRTHQIRIHLAGAGHPLLGDVRYGGARLLGDVEIPRVALHAARLELPGGETFEAPWPADFASWVERLRAGA
jgi:23S rRNA-/tRNA-specific pseudouridylate synthase